MCCLTELEIMFFLFSILNIAVDFGTKNTKYTKKTFFVGNDGMYV